MLAGFRPVVCFGAVGLTGAEDPGRFGAVHGGV